VRAQSIALDLSERPSYRVGVPRNHAIVAALGPILRARRLWLAGIDVIDGWLTEVNVTSPSAARQINAVSGTRIEVPIVDFLERLARTARPPRPAGAHPISRSPPARRRNLAAPPEAHRTLTCHETSLR